MGNGSARRGGHGESWGPGWRGNGEEVGKEGDEEGGQLLEGLQEVGEVLVLRSNVAIVIDGAVGESDCIVLQCEGEAVEVGGGGEINGRRLEGGGREGMMLLCSCFFTVL